MRKMKKVTILPILLVIIVLTLTTTTLIPKQVHSLQGSYMYVSLSYGRGWWGWACVTEEGKTGVYGSPDNFCGARNCPFEAGSMWGEYPCAPLSFGVPAWGLVAEITIPEDLKLVTRDGYVVKNELCTGDEFKFSKGVEKGEFWERGGHEDSPPIYWVDDVEELVLDILDYHDKTTTTKEDVCSNPSGVPDGYIDEVAGIPVYTMTVPLGYLGKDVKLTGNMVCSIKEKELGILGAAESAGYYKAANHDISFNADFVVECMYYYFGGSGGYLNFPELQPCCKENYHTYQVPTVIQAGPDAIAYRDWGTHNIKYDTIEDFFRVGTINFEKTIKVVEPVDEPKLEVKSIITDNTLDYGETTFVRLLITNKGETEIKITSIESNVKHEFIVCDKEILEPEEQADCVLTVTPDKEIDITATVDFEYHRCGKRLESSTTGSSSTVTVQYLERCSKDEDCEDPEEVCCNRICRTDAKGACDDFDGDGTFEWDYYYTQGMK